MKKVTFSEIVKVVEFSEDSITIFNVVIKNLAKPNSANYDGCGNKKIVRCNICDDFAKFYECERCCKTICVNCLVIENVCMNCY